MGGHHIREKRPGGFQVMVIAVHAGGLEPIHLLLGKDPHRSGNLNIHLGFNGGHGLLQLVHEPVVRAFDRGNNAKLGGT